MIRGHGGEIYHLAREIGGSPEEILDLSSNVSPLPPPEGLYELLSAHIREIESLPEVDSFSLKRALAERYGLAPENFFPSSGTTEWIFALPEIVNPKRVVILGPTYADYEDAARRKGLPIEYLFAREEEDFTPPLKDLSDILRPKDLVYICNPNNPTGSFIPRENLLKLITTYSRTYFVVDESYLPFFGEDAVSLLSARPFPPNLIVLFSFSKIYRIPGLRLGFLTVSDSCKEKVSSKEIPWTVNRLAQIAGKFLLGQKNHEVRVRELVKREREWMRQELERLGLKVFPSHTNFLLVKLSPPLSGKNLRDALLKRHKILIRACYNFRGLDDRFIRVALKERENNQKFLNAFTEILRDLS